MSEASFQVTFPAARLVGYPGRLGGCKIPPARPDLPGDLDMMQKELVQRPLPRCLSRSVGVSNRKAALVRLVEERETKAERSWLRWLGLLLVAGYLLFSHGCHGDVDDELFVSRVRLHAVSSQPK
jgi:hypothetical protein